MQMLIKSTTTPHLQGRATIFICSCAIRLLGLYKVLCLVIHLLSLLVEGRVLRQGRTLQRKAGLALPMSFKYT